MFTIGQRVLWSYMQQGEQKYKHGTICRIFDEYLTIKIFDPYYGEWYYRKVPVNQLEPTTYSAENLKEIEL